MAENSTAAARLRVVSEHLTPPARSTEKSSAAAMSGGPLTSHVLDTASGRPAHKLPLTLYRRQGDDWALIKASETNSDGRCSGFLTREQFSADTYKLRFDTADYFQRVGGTTFYPYVEIVFQVAQPGEHYHVPLILSPYGYSTYRGS